MDPIAIAAGVVAVLTPLVKKGAEKFAEEAGQAVFDKAKSLFNILKSKCSGDSYAKETVAHFEQEPDDFKPAMENILKKKLAEDKSLADELTKIVQEIKDVGPNIRIVQEIEEAEKATMIEAEEVTEGTIEGTQKIGKVRKEATALKVGRIGRSR